VSQALAFAELLAGGVLLVSALTGHSLKDVLLGRASPIVGLTETATADPTTPQLAGASQTAPASYGGAGGPSAGGAISPFPRGAKLSWGRSDQGVDGTTEVGTPLLAIFSGTVSIEHDPGGFGASYPVLHTSHGDFYYGHVIPTVAAGAHVRAGQPIGRAHPGAWGNSTTPGGFEIGQWPPGGMSAGAAIRDWLLALPRIVFG
jgi:murein DD-endopeptidase MepM/ murein hydrolase activator NlpD